MQHLADWSVPIAPQRNIDIITDPTAQRDMPTLPKILQVVREIGPIKILGQAHPQQAGKADGNVAVAGKIHQNAQRDSGQ